MLARKEGVMSLHRIVNLLDFSGQSFCIQVRKSSLNVPSSFDHIVLSCRKRICRNCKVHLSRLFKTSFLIKTVGETAQHRLRKM